MSSQERAGWVLAVIGGIVGAFAGGVLAYGIGASGVIELFPAPQGGTLGGALAFIVVLFCVPVAAGAVAGTLIGLRIGRQMGGK